MNRRRGALDVTAAAAFSRGLFRLSLLAAVAVSPAGLGAFPPPAAFAAPAGAVSPLFRGGWAAEARPAGPWFEPCVVPGRGWLCVAELGEVTPEKAERWQGLTPEERERIRERYRRWKELPPEVRERILERQRRWRELPEAQRRYLRERREIYRNAWPEEKAVIRKFFRWMRELPPPRRRAMREKIFEWRDLPAAERQERLLKSPFFARLSPEERKVIDRFLFSEPPPAPPAPPWENEGPPFSPPMGPGGPPPGRGGPPPSPPRD